MAACHCNTCAAAGECFSARRRKRLKDVDATRRTRNAGSDGNGGSDGNDGRTLMRRAVRGTPEATVTTEALLM